MTIFSIQWKLRNFQTSPWTRQGDKLEVVFEFSPMVSACLVEEKFIVLLFTIVFVTSRRQKQCRERETIEWRQRRKDTIFPIPLLTIESFLLIFFFFFWKISSKCSPEYLSALEHFPIDIPTITRSLHIIRAYFRVYFPKRQLHLLKIFSKRVSKDWIIIMEWLNSCN